MAGIEPNWLCYLAGKSQMAHTIFSFSIFLDWDHSLEMPLHFCHIILASAGDVFLMEKGQKSVHFLKQCFSFYENKVLQLMSGGASLERPCFIKMKIV